MIGNILNSINSIINNLHGRGGGTVGREGGGVLFTRKGNGLVSQLSEKKVVNDVKHFQ